MSGRVVAVHIAEGDDVFILQGAQVRGAHPADADPGDVDLLVGGGGSAGGPGGEEGGRGQGGVLNELAAFRMVWDSDSD